MSELTVGQATSRRAAAERLGEALIDNRRDEVGGVMLVHAGWLVQMIEGARPDVDRALRRMQATGRNLRVLGDRPVMQRRTHAPIQMCPLTPSQVEAVLAGRPLDALSDVDLERLLCGEGRRLDAA